MKKIWKIGCNLITVLLTAFAIGMMIFTIVSVCLFNREDRTLMGYRFFVVLSDSMSKTDFDAGALVVTKEIDGTSLREGDIIAYISRNEDSYGATITHKIRSCVTDRDGNPGFITYGTTTDTDDTVMVMAPDVLGKYQFSIPYIGRFFTYLRTARGYVTCILIPFLILIVYQVIHCVQLFSEMKKEQKQELEAERKKTEEMAKELELLKAQIALQQEKDGKD